MGSAARHRLTRISLLGLALAAGSKAGAFEIAAVMGSPNAKLDFVSAILKKQTVLIPETPESDATTMQYSILAREGVLSVFSVAVMSDLGITQLPDALRGFSEGAQSAGIVLAYTGPFMEDDACAAMAALKDKTVFVIPAGSGQQNLDKQPATANCFSPNIMRVAALNGWRSGLAKFSDFGEKSVQIAAPGSDVMVTGADGRSQRMCGTSYAASSVAAALAEYARAYPQLHGNALAQEFLDRAAYELSSLSGKIKNSKATDGASELANH